ncbi:hypothetical protein M0804_007975 [Polistes exclamans]|nr:hypothetical protein M0804_007975 [Polistes exclamans]
MGSSRLRENSFDNGEQWAHRMGYRIRKNNFNVGIPSLFLSTSPDPTSCFPLYHPDHPRKDDVAGDKKRREVKRREEKRREESEEESEEVLTPPVLS